MVTLPDQGPPWAIAPRSIAMQRRRFLQCSAMAGTVAGLAGGGAWPLAARALQAASPPAHADDWAWLTGNWDVRHRRLRQRMVGSNDWDTFDGRSAVWPTLGGLGNLDDNIVGLPSGPYRGVSLRAYDAASDTWAIWWMDGRDPTRIDPPVHGRFEGDTGIFTGRDTLRGKPILMRFAWRDIHGVAPWWEQAFSGDEGRSWEVNWRNWFTRTAHAASPLPVLSDAPRDWDFLQGKWQVLHRRLRDPLAAGNDWEAFEGTLAQWPLLGGHGNALDVVMQVPGANKHLLWMHSHDPRTREWLAWQLDLDNPTRIAEPQRGLARDGAITFSGESSIGAQRLWTRTTWTPAGPGTARREQALSLDGGSRWSPWWTSELKRVD